MATSRSLHADLAVRLQDAVEAARVPGASLAVWDKGEVRVASAGYANADAGIEVDDRTIFQVGSITKLFTATLLMGLHDEGIMDIDAPVARHLPDFRIAGGVPPDRLTVRTLLDYTSGIAGDYFADFGCGPDALARYVDSCAELPLLFAPGTMRGYSSTAYCVAGRVIEQVMGRPFDVALTQRLLQPLGIERYAFYTHDVARYRTAVGHHEREDGRFEVASALRLPHCMSASGASLTMTARDLLRFAELHIEGGTTAGGQRLLTAESCARMGTASRHLPPNDTPVMIGWAPLATDREPVLCASGQTIGQNALLIVAPAQRFAMALLTNVGGGALRLLIALGADLLRDATGAALTLPRPEVDPAAVVGDPARYVGDYTNHTRITVSAGNDGMAARIVAKDVSSGEDITQRLPLVPIGADRFAAGTAEQPGAVLQFLFADGDQAAHVASGGSIFARCDADGRVGAQQP